MVRTCFSQFVRSLIFLASNRPFLNSIVPLFQNESKCETVLMKMNSACSFIFVQIKVIFIRIVLHLDSLWNRGTRELGSGLCFIFLAKVSLFTVLFCFLLCLFVLSILNTNVSASLTSLNRDAWSQVTASLAQWSEHWSRKPGVESSNLSWGCNFLCFLCRLMHKWYFNLLIHSQIGRFLSHFVGTFIFLASNSFCLWLV